MNEDEVLAQVLTKLNDLDMRLAKMEKYLERQKGFIGGILLVASIVAWAVSQVTDWFK